MVAREQENRGSSVLAEHTRGSVKWKGFVSTSAFCFLKKGVLLPQDAWQGWHEEWFWDAHHARCERKWKKSHSHFLPCCSFPIDELLFAKPQSPANSNDLSRKPGCTECLETRFLTSHQYFASVYDWSLQTDLHQDEWAACIYFSKCW